MSNSIGSSIFHGIQAALSGAVGAQPSTPSQQSSGGSGAGEKWTPPSDGIDHGNIGKLRSLLDNPILHPLPNLGPVPRS
jgi:hypothetical protein